MKRKKSHEDGYVEEQKVEETGQHKNKGYREKKECFCVEVIVMSMILENFAITAVIDGYVIP